MQKLKIFYLEGCPYCRMAVKAVEALRSEHPADRSAEIEWIEESSFPEVADHYDYYYVPSIFYGDDKLYECSPKDDYEEIKRQIENALKLAAEG